MNLKLFSVVFLGGISLACAGQDFIGDSREKVRKKLRDYLQQTKVSVDFMETDTSLALLLNDQKYKPVDFIFLFDTKNNCVSEIRTGCDTCVANYLNQALERKGYDWKQITPTSFLSGSRHRLLMELLSTAKGSSLCIKKLGLSRRDYNQLLKAKVKN